jgi:hypothetical protein
MDKKMLSTLLTEEQFWTIIENSDKCRNLENELNKLTEEEFFGYHYWWDYFHLKSYNQALWAVAYVVLGGCSNDGFDYFRYWLVTRGKSVYMKAIQDADSLFDEFEGLTDDEYPQWEEVSYVYMEVFENKFNKDFYDAEEESQKTIEYEEIHRPEISFEWDGVDEDSIRNVCPKTFDKWWGNDKF